jgi:hypothetical protein
LRRRLELLFCSASAGPNGSENVGSVSRRNFAVCTIWPASSVVNVEKVLAAVDVLDRRTPGLARVVISSSIDPSA